VTEETGCMSQPCAAPRDADVV